MLRKREVTHAARGQWLFERNGDYVAVTRQRRTTSQSNTTSAKPT